MSKILLATHNPGKVVEFREILLPLGFEIILPETLNIPEPEETGLTFVENALIKARHAARLSDLPVLADDSGLVVEALHGAPGIYSSRFARKGASSAENNQKLLNELKNVPEEKRQAHLYAVLVYLRYTEDPMPIIGQGRWDGSITTALHGSHDFGYNPLIYIPEYQCTVAELPATVRNQISHRAKALQSLLSQLSSAVIPYKDCTVSSHQGR